MTHRRHYTPQEVALARSRWGEVRARVIAQELGRTVHGVRHMARLFGFTRTAKQKSAIYRTWKRGRKVNGRLDA